MVWQLVAKKPFYPLFSFKTELVTFEWKPRGYKERARARWQKTTQVLFFTIFPDVASCSRILHCAPLSVPMVGGGSIGQQGVRKEFIEYGTPLAIFGFRLAFCEYSILKTWAFLSLNKS